MGCLSLFLFLLGTDPSPRPVSGRGQEGLNWPPLAQLPALWGLDRKLGLQPEPRLPPFNFPPCAWALGEGRHPEPRVLPMRLAGGLATPARRVGAGAELTW